MCVAGDNNYNIITLIIRIFVGYKHLAKALIVGRRPEPVCVLVLMSCLHSLVVSGRLNQGRFHALLGILLLDVAGQSHCASALSSGVIDVAKIVQCSTFQHLLCLCVGGGGWREGGREMSK